MAQTATGNIVMQRAGNLPTAAQSQTLFNTATISRMNFSDFFGWAGTITIKPVFGAARVWFDQGTNLIQAVDSNGNAIMFDGGGIGSGIAISVT